MFRNLDALPRFSKKGQLVRPALEFVGEFSTRWRFGSPSATPEAQQIGKMDVTKDEIDSPQLFV